MSSYKKVLQQAQEQKATFQSSSGYVPVDVANEALHASDANQALGSSNLKEGANEELDSIPAMPKGVRWYLDLVGPFFKTTKSWNNLKLG